MIERFTKEEFENALPVNKRTGSPLWERVGMVSGEMAYIVQVNDFARIMIRSSIDDSGIAASAGEDSIRMWIERRTASMGWRGMKKIGNYTTRTKGWDYRIVDRLRELWMLAVEIKRVASVCEKCDKEKAVWFVKKGKNEGRPCAKCFACDSGWEWMDEEKIVEVENSFDDILNEIRADPVTFVEESQQEEDPTSSTTRMYEEEEEKEFVEFDFAKYGKIPPDEQQFEAITTPLESAVRVIAGAGSGKTWAIENRVMHLIENGAAPGEILYVTFNKAMADEGAKRIGEKLKNGGADEFTIEEYSKWFCTIHAACFRMMKDEGDRRVVVHGWYEKKVINEIALKLWTVPEQRPKWSEIASAIANAKARGLQSGPDVAFYCDLWGDFQGTRLGETRKRFDREIGGKSKKYRSGALTFGDMLYDAEQMLIHDGAFREKWQSQFKYVIVDEGQDTNAQAMRVLSTLAEPQNRFFVVGDADQLLYRFTGATPEENLYEGFERRYENGIMVKLETNYRSTEMIVDQGNKLIHNNYEGSGGPYEDKYIKELRARNVANPGDNIVFTEHETPEEEARAVAEEILRLVGTDEWKPGDFFIGARTRAQLAYLEGPLMMADIPYINLTGGSFWQLKHVSQMVSYLKLAFDEEADDAFGKIFNVGSNLMVYPWGEQKGEYCTHRWLGTAFLSACRGSYTNVDQAVRSRKSYEPGVSDLVGLVQDIKFELAKSAGDAMQYIFDECVKKYLIEEEGIVDDEAENSKLSDCESAIAIARNYGEPQKFLAFVEKAIQAAEDAKNKKWDRYVVLSTIHRLKGLERPVVFGLGWSEGSVMKDGVPTGSAGLLPHTFSMVPPPQTGVLEFGGMGRIEDERCMAYVLVTRAKERVYLSSVRYWRNCEFGPSRFVEELGLI